MIATRKEFDLLMKACYGLAREASLGFTEEGSVRGEGSAARFGAVLFEHCLRNDIRAAELAAEPHDEA